MQRGEEPRVTLANGARVLIGTYVTIIDLIVSGHTITVTDGGVLPITPRISDDWYDTLDRTAIDVKAILDCCAVLRDVEQ